MIVNILGPIFRDGQGHRATMVAWGHQLLAQTMNQILEQVTPETAAALIASLAQANGSSIDDYLHGILAQLAEAHGMGFDAYVQNLLLHRSARHQAEAVNFAEIDQLLDELSEGTEQVTPLPFDFSRADIYLDHS